MQLQDLFGYIIAQFVGGVTYPRSRAASAMSSIESTPSLDIE